MSKLLPFLVAGVGASSVSVGGVFMLKRTGGGEGGTGDSSAKGNDNQQKLSADLGFKSLSEFETQKGGECATTNFPTLENFSNKGKTIANNEKIDNNYFSGSEPVQSCLVVNGERTGSSNTNDTNNKGKGEFRWLGTFVKGDKGMIVFTSYKPHSTEQQIIVEGGIYFLNKSTTPEKWTIEKHKEIKTNDTTPKTLSSTTFDASFPKKGEAITNLTKEPNKEKGGFISGQGDLSKLCKSGESNCPASAAAEKTFKGSWKGTPVTGTAGTSDKTIDQWGQSVVTTITTLYGSDGIELNTAFSTIKGTGTPQNLQEPQ